MSLPANPRAVVTGAAGGLGRAFCAALIQKGGTVVVSDIDLDAAQRTAAELGPDRAHAVRCDVARLEDVEQLAVEAERRLGGVDLVINNAGVAAGGPMGEIPIDTWQWIMGINLWGVIHGCQVFLPKMKRQGSGHILNVASAAGLLAAPNMAPYNVTKAAVVALSETMFGELAGTGVGVSVLCPTFFQTNIAASARIVGDDGMTGGMTSMVNTLMKRSRIQAKEVAQLALDGCARGDLHIVPHRDGRVMWRFKRLSPASFHRVVPKLLALRARRG